MTLIIRMGPKTGGSESERLESAMLLTLKMEGGTTIQKNISSFWKLEKVREEFYPRTSRRNVVLSTL